MTSPGGGGFAESVTNGHKGGRGLLVGGDVTEKKSIHIFWFHPSSMQFLEENTITKYHKKCFLACS